METHEALGEHRVIVLPDRADVIDARHVLGAQDEDHARRRAHRRQIDRSDTGVGPLREAEIGVQELGGLWQIVDVMGFAADVLMR